jgi:hypothetical protein
MTPMDIGGAIQAVKALLDLSKGLAAVVKRIGDNAIKAELNEKIIEVQQRAMQLQEAIVELREENARLRKEAEAAANLEAFKARYRYEESVRWKYDDAGKRIDGPFCPNCVDEGKERRLNPGATKGTYSCVVHRASFTTAEYDDRPHGQKRRPSGPHSWMG